MSLVRLLVSWVRCRLVVYDCDYCCSLCLLDDKDALPRVCVHNKKSNQVLALCEVFPLGFDAFVSLVF